MVAKKAGKVGRPRSFDLEQALEQAMYLFWANGYEGTSTAELSRVMGIEPASLYQAFGSKEQLFLQALKRYAEGPTAFIRHAVLKETAYAVAEAILQQSAMFLSQRSLPRGCMTIQAGLTGHTKTEQIQTALRDLRAGALSELQKRFERARAEGDLPDSADPNGLARFITTVYQGMAVQSAAGARRTDLLKIAEIALQCWPRTASK